MVEIHHLNITFARLELRYMVLDIEGSMVWSGGRENMTCVQQEKAS